MISRRRFLTLLGLAPLVPVAAKLAPKPQPKFTLAKLKKCAALLDANEVAEQDRIFWVSQQALDDLLRDVQPITEADFRAVQQWTSQCAEIAREQLAPTRFFGL